eukprot:c23187_g1_i4 orf=100-1251(+)
MAARFGFLRCGGLRACASPRHLCHSARSRYPLPLVIQGCGFSACEILHYSFGNSGQADMPSKRHVVTQTTDQFSNCNKDVNGLRMLLWEKNIFLISCHPGLNTRVLCPKCEGGHERYQSLTVKISIDGEFAMWNCFRGTCGWNGRVGDAAYTVDTLGTSLMINGRDDGAQGLQSAVEFTEESLHLRPLSEELITYLSTRGISKETLSRNGVKEATLRFGVAIAFPYRKDGKIVGCKYRTLGKRYSMEKNSQKLFYGLDDIKDVNEVIIVEGEIDKLSMEEVGFLNCVSVPDGAPLRVSDQSPSAEAEDKRYQYIWNCKEYFEKVDRIILATDGDSPGQALAEEIVRRLGRERSWCVKWPGSSMKKCKDANEVLLYISEWENIS